VKKVFNPEFLNRIDETIVFKSLDEHDIKNIVEILIGQLNARIEKKNIRIEVTDEVKDFLVQKGYDPEYGARPLRRAIQKYIEDPLSLKMIEGGISEGSTIEISMADDEVAFNIRKDEAALTGSASQSLK